MAVCAVISLFGALVSYLFIKMEDRSLHDLIPTDDNQSALIR